MIPIVWDNLTIGTLHLYDLRNFDPEKDEHPVAWLLEKATPDLYESLRLWLEEVLGEALPSPADIIVPDRFFGNMFLAVRMSLGEIINQVVGTHQCLVCRTLPCKTA